MSNALTQKPIIIDTDMTTFRGASAVTALGWTQGLRVTKLVLAVGGSAVSVAGTVTIQDPNNATLYPPLVVLASQAANTILYVDEPTEATGALTWRDFAVTGVTATKTILYLWYEV